MPIIAGVPLYAEAFALPKRGRPGKDNGHVIGKLESQKRIRADKREQAIEAVAILDFETDPFDRDSGERVFPFCAVLYGEAFETVVIWEEDHERFIAEVIAAINGLPGAHTIYAHNGGKFDYLFLLHRLRGFVSFKGRGIMSASIGPHVLRDSFHIIPEKLANWQKDTFDYTKLYRSKRAAHKEEIIRYCINDCRYLLEIVKDFLRRFGFRISIGQAAMYELRKSYKVKKLGGGSDEYLRQWFFGGRVECLQGRGRFSGEYKLYDVNSMYPHVMAKFAHPVGNEFVCRAGMPGSKTVFLDLLCRNRGALVRRTDNNETSATEADGRFRTTIWEYETALKYGLIDRVKIVNCIDFAERSDFSKFIVPMYSERLETKRQLKTLQSGSYEYNEAKKNDIFLKLIMNNAYGKFAQNPRRYKQTYITDHGEKPPEDEASQLSPWDLLPTFESPLYDIWERANPSIHFNNVATAASITGAARAQLMEAIVLADDPIYCDTDSVICRSLPGLKLDGIELGAWDLESEFDDVIIAGKKLYACKVAGKPDGHRDRLKIRSKGVQISEIKASDSADVVASKQRQDWQTMLDILDGQIREVVSQAPTFNRFGDQFYMKRRIRATAPLRQRKTGATPYARKAG